MKILMKKENYACFFKECNIEIWCTIQKRKENTSLKKNWDSLWLCFNRVMYIINKKNLKKKIDSKFTLCESVWSKFTVLNVKSKKKNSAEKKEKEEKRKIHFHCTAHLSKKSINLEKSRIIVLIYFVNWIFLCDENVCFF